MFLDRNFRLELISEFAHSSSVGCCKLLDSLVPLSLMVHSNEIPRRHQHSPLPNWQYDLGRQQFSPSRLVVDIVNFHNRAAYKMQPTHRA